MEEKITMLKTKLRRYLAVLMLLSFVFDTFSFGTFGAVLPAAAATGPGIKKGETTGGGAFWNGSDYQLGKTANFLGYTWLLYNKDTDYAYVITKSPIGASIKFNPTKANETNKYANSNLRTVVNNLETSLKTGNKQAEWENINGGAEGRDEDYIVKHYMAGEATYKEKADSGSPLTPCTTPEVTTDKLYILSDTEAMQGYFATAANRAPIEWADEAYWLRSPKHESTGGAGGTARFVNTDGTLGNSSVSDTQTVRPALQISFASPLFQGSASYLFATAANGKAAVTLGGGFMLQTADSTKLTKQTKKALTFSGTTQTASGTMADVAEEVADRITGNVIDLTTKLVTGKQLKVTYSGFGTNEAQDHVAAIVSTGTGTGETYVNYAKLSTANAATNLAVDTSNLASGGTYNLYLFAEKIGTDDDSATELKNAGTFTLTAPTYKNYGILDSHKTDSLTAKLGGSFDLGFNADTYSTAVTVEAGQTGSATADASESGDTLVSGTGTTTITGSVNIAGTLTTAGSFNLRGADSTINGTSGAHAVLKGSAVTIGGGRTTVGQYGELQNDVTISSGATLEAYTTGLKSSAVTNSGNLNLTGAGTLAQNVANSGTVKFSAGSGSTITASGNYTENGTLEVESGMLKYTGTSIANKVKIDAGATLDPNANVFGGDIENDGKLVLTGTIADITAPVAADTGYLNANVTGTGTVQIGSGTDAAHVYLADGKQITAGNLDIQTNAAYTGAAGAMTISNAVTNAGTLNLTDGTLNQAVTGTGNVAISGSVRSNAANFAGTGTLSVTSGGELDILSGELAKNIDNSGIVTLEEGAAFGANGKITGGTASLGKDVEFEASNLDGTAKLYANDAIYNFGAALSAASPYIGADDIINVSEDAAGTIKLGTITLNGTASNEWAAGSSKEMRYLAAGADSNLTITNSKVKTNTGFKYTFSQAKDGSADKIGWMNVLKENAMELTLKQIVNNNPSPAAGEIDEYSVEGLDKTTTEDLGALDNTQRDGVFTIAGSSPSTDVLDGSGKGGIITADTAHGGAAGDTLNLVSLTVQNFKPAVENKTGGIVTLKNVTFKNNEEWDIVNEGTVKAKGTNEFDKGISGANGALVAEAGAVLKGQSETATSITAKTLNGAGDLTAEKITINVAENGEIAGKLALNNAKLEGKGKGEAAETVQSLASDSSAEIKDIAVNVSGKLGAGKDLTVTNADVNVKGNMEIGGNASVTGTTDNRAKISFDGEGTIGGNAVLNNGEINGGRLDIKGNLDTKGGSGISGDVTLHGSFNINDTTKIAGTFTPKGALNFNLDGEAKKNGYVFIDNTAAAEPMELANAGVNLIQTDEYYKLNKGESMTLISKAKNYMGDPEVWTREGVRKYLYGVGIDASSALMLSYLDNGAADQTKSFSEARLGASAALNSASDLIAGQIIDGTASSDTWEAFAAVQGSRSRYETGSHVDLNGTNVAAGLSKKVKDNVTLGIFAEGGSGRYTAHNEFETGDVRADGDVNYFGGGVFAKIEAEKTAKGQLHGEASFRAGHISSDYSSETFNPGTSTRFDTSGAYLGAHAGIGYKWNVKNGGNVDTYVKYLWNRQNGDSPTIAGEKFDLDEINSRRLRAGFRYNGKENENGVNFFGGLAYEYEFDGKAKGRLGEYSLLEPDFKGGSGMAELGIKYDNSDSPWKMEFGLTGYTGKRDSIGANLSAWYEFGRYDGSASIRRGNIQRKEEASVYETIAKLTELIRDLQKKLEEGDNEPAETAKPVSKIKPPLKIEEPKIELTTETVETAKKEPKKAAAPAKAVIKEQKKDTAPAKAVKETEKTEKTAVKEQLKAVKKETAKQAKSAVQIAASQNKGACEGLAAKAKKAGFDTKVITARKGSATIYRVRVFSDSQTPEALLKQVQAKGFNGFIARD